MKKISMCVTAWMIVFCISGCSIGNKNVKKVENGCTFCVTCENAINSTKLSKDLRKVLPEDGIIFEKKEVTFSEGESVFDILKREMKNSGIMMESSVTPGTNSVYIEGIDNLYEFDCGEQSGWMYTVNGEEKGISCSVYEVQQGDEIIFQYTLRLGNDIQKEEKASE